MITQQRCLVCGEYHGDGLPCPTMDVMGNVSLETNPHQELFGALNEIGREEYLKFLNGGWDKTLDNESESS